MLYPGSEALDGGPLDAEGNRHRPHRHLASFYIALRLPDDASLMLGWLAARSCSLLIRGTRTKVSMGVGRAMNHEWMGDCPTVYA
jgi:hypothetical protein